jgi:signal transduction histidine kinase
MVEIRVAVDDDTSVHGLMRRLAALFGRSAISFDRSCNEVRIVSEWESRGVVRVIDAVEDWINEDGGEGATMWIGEHSYRLAGPPLPAGRPMIALEADRRNTLELVQQVSLASRGGVSPQVFLQRVCGAVAEMFAFDCVTALQFHPEAEEVSEVAVAGDPPAEQECRWAIAWAPLLVRAWESQALVFVSGDEGGDAGSAFALPLTNADRCLGFLSGNRRGIGSPDEREAAALETVGVVAGTLLDNALARHEAQQLDVLKSEFIALAAHELRSPLSSIYGLFITLDERGEALAESDRLAVRDALREQTMRMRGLIEQLLDLSRFDLVAVPVSPETLRLRPKIEEVVRTVAGALPDQVTIAVPPDLEAEVDPNGLDRMLSNLIANALRHGKPPVTVMAARRDTHLRLAVEDRGEGVGREFVPRLFDRFTRSAESRGRTDGSGLGLAIARAYARAHGGDIVYEPAVPHGARFEVVIPLRAPDAGRPESAPQVRASPKLDPPR